MQFAHAGDDGLACFFVVRTRNDGSSCRQTVQRAHLFLVALGLGLDGDVNHRVREDHALEDHRALGSHRVRRW